MLRLAAVIAMCSLASCRGQAEAPVARVDVPTRADPLSAPSGTVPANVRQIATEPTAGIRYEKRAWTLELLASDLSSAVIRFQGANCTDAYVSVTEDAKQVLVIPFVPTEGCDQADESVLIVFPTNLNDRKLLHAV